MSYAECHGHIILNGSDYKIAVDRHRNGIDREAVRANLEALRRCRVTYFRDGGDALGVSLYAREMAGEYGIDYVTPAFAIHREGRYGDIVGRGYGSLSEYIKLVAEAAREGCDFIKLMLSGLVCFDVYGRLSCPPLPPGEIRELVHIAHEEGFRVMAHVNGAETIKAALEAGVDSIEHGYFMDDECLALLKQTGSVWVPTIAAAAAFLTRDGCDRAVTERVVSAQEKNLRAALAAGALVATGSDSGAVGVPHGQGLLLEQSLLRRAAGDSLSEALTDCTERGNTKIRTLFRRA